jgi:uroporphyrinogen III methyltransferase / synthase
MTELSKEVPSNSLSGRVVLITRTAEGNAVEKRKLEALGANVIELESIKIAPPSSWERLDEAISTIQQFDWVFFTSANGIKLFFSRLDQKGKLHELTGLNRKPKFACVGPSTRRALEELGFDSSFEPKDFLTTSLGREFVNSFEVKGMKILLARAERANNEIAKILAEAGGEVYEASVYRTESSGERSGQNRKSALPEAVLDSLTDITFTSPSTVEGLLDTIAVEKILARHIRIHCIGPVTARAAEERGLRVSTVPSVHTVEGLIAAMTGKKEVLVKN